jgi:hypothetical protein
MDHRFNPPKLPRSQPALNWRDAPKRTGMPYQIKKRRKHQGLCIKPSVLSRRRYLFGESFEKLVTERSLDEHGGSHFAATEIV